jgi:hypothetical protein
MNIATPPPITSSGLATLYNSTNDNAFLGSSIPECFRVLQGGGATSFSLEIFNRSATGLKSTYTITGYSGLWSYIVSNKQRLTCSLIYSANTSTYAFIALNRTSNTFAVRTTAAKSALPTQLSSLSTVQMANVLLDQSCESLRYGNNIWSISITGSLTTLTGFGSSIMASSSDLQYVVASNTLYRRSSTTGYTALTVLATQTNYWVKSWLNRVVVWGSTSSAGTNGTYDITQTVYAILDNNGAANVFLTRSISSFSNLGTSVPVHISP